MVEIKETRLYINRNYRFTSTDSELKELLRYQGKVNEIWTEINNVTTAILVLCTNGRNTETNGHEFKEIATKSF